MGRSSKRLKSKKSSWRYLETFTVRDDLVGHAIGRKGTKIQQARKITGIVRIELVENTFKVFGETREAAKKARGMLEFVEEIADIPGNLVGKVFGRKGHNMQEMKRLSGVVEMCRKRGQKQDLMLAQVPLRIMGTVESVTSARMLLEQKVKQWAAAEQYQHTKLEDEQSQNKGSDSEVEVHEEVGGCNRPGGLSVESQPEEPLTNEKLTHDEKNTGPETIADCFSKAEEKLHSAEGQRESGYKADSFSVGAGCGYSRGLGSLFFYGAISPESNRDLAVIERVHRGKRDNASLCGYRSKEDQSDAGYAFKEDPDDEDTSPKSQRDPTVNGRGYSGRWDNGCPSKKITSYAVYPCKSDPDGDTSPESRRDSTVNGHGYSRRRDSGSFCVYLSKKDPSDADNPSNRHPDDEDTSPESRQDSAMNGHGYTFCGYPSKKEPSNAAFIKWQQERQNLYERLRSLADWLSNFHKASSAFVFGGAVANVGGALLEWYGTVTDKKGLQKAGSFLQKSGYLTATGTQMVQEGIDYIKVEEAKDLVRQHECTHRDLTEKAKCLTPGSFHGDYEMKPRNDRSRFDDDCGYKPNMSCFGLNDKNWPSSKAGIGEDFTAGVISLLSSLERILNTDVRVTESLEIINDSWETMNGTRIPDTVRKLRDLTEELEKLQDDLEIKFKKLF